MPSPAELFAMIALLGAQTAEAPPELARSEGPRATSGEGQRYDQVGRVVPGDGAGSAIGAAHATLAVGSIAEVTALDTGRTILVPVTAQAAGGGLIALAPGAMQALGIGANAGVRVRSATVSPQDEAAVKAGQPGTPRLDAPPVLLVGLRKLLMPLSSATVPIAPIAAAKPVPAPKPPQARPAQRPIDPPSAQVPVVAKPTTLDPARGWFVQVAALSSEARARDLAGKLGGQARASGRLWRVQLGPFGDAGGANAARANAVKRGYADAQVFRIR